ncbi:MAG: hypothetical protein IT303_03800 [Dehalococcoidia bacterium]|nr:hypothetical protein [Dehalococcoidia bacterium]
MQTTRAAGVLFVLAVVAAASAGCSGGGVAAGVRNDSHRELLVASIEEPSERHQIEYGEERRLARLDDNESAVFVVWLADGTLLGCIGVHSYGEPGGIAEIVESTYAEPCTAAQVEQITRGTG